MNKKILGLLCIIFILLSGVFYLQSEESKNEYKDQNVVISEDNEAEEVTSEKADTSVDEIAVYICGAVRHPGVYYFKEGSRINDAVRAAGGFKKKAAKTEVNLAESLCDGQQILIPSKGHIKNETADGTGESPGENSSGLVNINTASAEVLQSLPGIGLSKAAAIIEYRSSDKFNSIEDIKNVPGIKDGVYNQIKNKITI